MTLLVLAALVSWADVDPALRPAFDKEGMGEERIGDFVRMVERQTGTRVREGMAEHAVYYVLQSKSFTTLPPIVPAAGARTWHQTRTIPVAVRERIHAFLAAQDLDSRGRLLAGHLPATERTAYLEESYRRAMRFLHAKEIESLALEGQQRRNEVASLYTTRGHSTDTSIEAAFAASIELAALSGRAPGSRIRRVLIAGPGLDLAPRENLADRAPPQSVQPYAVADALVRSGLAAADDLVIDCADVNPAVVEFIRNFPENPRLVLLRPEGASDSAKYANGLADRIARVPVDLARRIRAERWNILTRRPPVALYDLVVATNVLLYFSRRELLLAINNIHAALRPGGYFLHNDTRGEIEEFTVPAGFGPVNARMVRLGERGSTVLYDAAVLHRKSQ
jgi:hypothetical protein